MLKLAFATLICAVWALGCSYQVDDPEPGSQEDVGTAALAIKDHMGQGGNAVPPDNSSHMEINFYGMVGPNRDILVWLNRCSGELISNWWVMTAKHCFKHEATSGFFARVQMGAQTFNNAKIFHKHPTSDVALIKLPKPALMNGQYTTWQRSMNPYVLSGDKGLAFGYGSGRLAYSTVAFNLDDTSIWNIFYQPGELIVAEPGDSGGGIFNHLVVDPATGHYVDMTLAGLFTTGGAGPSVSGIRVWAREIMFPDQFIYCHGIECFTTKPLLPNLVSSERLWVPCRGQAFDFEAEYSMETGYDFVRFNENLKLSGDTVAPNAPYRGRSNGRLKVWLTTDSSVLSRGLVSLRAWCPQNF
jgi:hypothetical protein